MEYAIVVNNLSKKYRNFNLNNISLKIQKGKMHAIVGATGSGKTVTINAIVGGIKRINGDILINNYRPSKAAAKKNLGYVPDSLKFPKNITPYYFLKSLAKMNGVSKKVIKVRLPLLMKEFNIWEFRDSNINTFSNGMKKKLMLIQGIIHNPEILILDEPEAGLDTNTRKQILSYLRTLANEGKTILFSTHLLNEVKDIIDECSIIYNGNLLYSGSIDTFKLTNSFIIECEDNEKMISLFAEHKIEYLLREETNDLFFKLNNSLEINKIFLFAIENNLIIFRLEPYNIDLDFFYNSLVSEKVSE